MSEMQGYPQDETVMTTQNSRNMTIWNLIFVFCIKLSILMGYFMIEHINKSDLVFKEP